MTGARRFAFYFGACTLAAVAAYMTLALPLPIVALAWSSLCLPPLVYRFGQARFTSFVGLRYLRDVRRSAALWFFLLLGMNLLVNGAGLAAIFHARPAMFLLLGAVVILFVCGVASYFTVYTTISIVGVTFGVACLVIVLSVMSGFEGDLRDKILGANAHVVVRARTGDLAGWHEAMELVRAVPGVVGVTPILENEVMIVSPTNPAGALLKGIDPRTIGEVVDLPNKIEEGKLSYLEEPGKLLTLPSAVDDVFPVPVGKPESGPSGGAAGTISPSSTRPDADDPFHPKSNEGRDLPDILFPEHRAGNESLPSRALKEYPGIVVGKELARTLHVYVGDEVNVVSPSADLGPMGPIPKKRSFRVAAVFYTGMYEFDTKYAYVLLSVAQQFFNVGDAVTGLEARASDPALAPDVAIAIRERLAHWSAPAAATAAPEPAAFDPLAWEETHGGVPATTAPVPGSNLVDTIGSHGPDDSTAGGTLEVLDWQQMNRGLFSALRLEKTAMFVILTFIVLVAAFNIVSTLVMVVLEKGREIAILKSMGTSARGVVRIFVTQGLAIGLLGAAWGITIGYAGCVYMNTVGIQLDPDVYYISSLPVRTDLAEFAVVGLAAVAISVLATIYPAWQASRLNPIDGLRYE